MNKLTVFALVGVLFAATESFSGHRRHNNDRGRSRGVLFGVSLGGVGFGLGTGVFGIGRSPSSAPIAAGIIPGDCCCDNSCRTSCC